MEGWIKIHRKMLEWEWYDDTNTKVVFLHLLLNANIKPSKYHGCDIPAGGLVTSQDSLSEQTGLTRQQVRTALKHLENTGEINQQPNQQFTIITICKWESYQCNEETPNQRANQQPTNEQPATNQRLTIEEEYKNIRKEEGKNSVSANALTYEQRCQNFYNEVALFVNDYPREMLRAFYDYWSEPTQTKEKKLRKEKERTWDTKRRLENWARRENNLKKNNYGTNERNTAERIEQARKAAELGYAMFMAEQDNGNKG